MYFYVVCVCVFITQGRVQSISLLKPPIYTCKCNANKLISVFSALSLTPKPKTFPLLYFSFPFPRLCIFDQWQAWRRLSRSSSLIFSLLSTNRYTLSLSLSVDMHVVVSQICSILCTFWTTWIDYIQGLHIQMNNVLNWIWYCSTFFDLYDIENVWSKVRGFDLPLLNRFIDCFIP